MHTNAIMWHCLCTSLQVLGGSIRYASLISTAGLPMGTGSLFAGWGAVHKFWTETERVVAEYRKWT